MSSNTNCRSWHERRFGDYLEKFNSHERVFVKYLVDAVFSGKNEQEKENCTNNKEDLRGKIIGLHFVPINDGLNGCMKYLNQDLTDDLKELYFRVNENFEDDRCFEVVQICFPQKPPYSRDAILNEDVKKEFESRCMDVPWFALPVQRIEKSVRIRHYYGIRDGEFALVLLETGSGKLITKRGYDSLMEDRSGCSLPWVAPDTIQILKNIPAYFTGSQKVSDFREQGTDLQMASFQDVDRDAVIGLYFSAHWCPPCKAFTTQLIQTYKRINEKGKKFQVVLVSSDRSADSYLHYVSKMPWLSIPYEDNESRAQLTSLFGIQGIPSLILLNPDGSVITEDGRGEVNEDPEGTKFPWYSKSVNVLTPRLAAKLQKYPAVVLFTDGEEDVEIELATAVLTPVSEYVKKKYDEELLFFIAVDSDTSDSLRDYLRLDDVSPLLTLADISLGRFAVMEYGEEITEKSIINFIDKFYINELIFTSIN